MAKKMDNNIYPLKLLPYCQCLILKKITNCVNVFHKILKIVNITQKDKNTPYKIIKNIKAKKLKKKQILIGFSIFFLKKKILDFYNFQSLMLQFCLKLRFSGKIITTMTVVFFKVQQSQKKKKKKKKRKKERRRS
jgi:hypothetical protein